MQMVTLAAPISSVQDNGRNGLDNASVYGFDYTEAVTALTDSKTVDGAPKAVHSYALGLHDNNNNNDNNFEPDLLQHQPN
jgi:hypothetical protein